MRKLILALYLILNVFTQAMAETDDSFFMLKSTSFHDKGILDDRYTCDGKDISPGFTWSNVPAGTKSLVLTFTDVDAPSGIFYHWILYDMPPDLTSLPEGINQLPTPTKVGKNSWNKNSYNGPCPPPKSTHYYTVTLYALNDLLNVPDLDSAKLNDLLQNNVIQKVELGVIYGH